MRAKPADEDFRTLLEPHRRAITLHGYRMLGSLQEAEEIAQDSLLRAWQRLDQQRAPGATRAWLYKIATNACLDVLKVRRRRTVPPPVGPTASVAAGLGPPLPEGVWIEPAPDALFDAADEAAARPDQRVSLRESVGLAFITALQLLSPKQRAALLLVDVLGWRPEDTASLLDTTVASVNSLLQRARKNVESRAGDDGASGPADGPADDALLRRYIATWESGDLDAFAALLAEDARLVMPPQPAWYAGRAAICQFLAHIMATRPYRYRLVPVAANRQAAVAVYTAPPTSGELCAAAIHVIAMRDGRVTQMTRFATPHLFPRFGLPMHLPDARS